MTSSCNNQLFYKPNIICNTTMECPTFTLVVSGAQNGWDVITKPWEIISTHMNTQTHTPQTMHQKRTTLYKYDATVAELPSVHLVCIKQLTSMHVQSGMWSTNHIPPLRTRANQREAQSIYCDSLTLPPCRILWKRSVLNSIESVLVVYFKS